MPDWLADALNNPFVVIVASAAALLVNRVWLDPWHNPLDKPVPASTPRGSDEP